jgi:putative hemolysin
MTISFDCGQKNHKVSLSIAKLAVITADESLSDMCIFDGDCVADNPPPGIRKVCEGGTCRMHPFDSPASLFCLEKGFHLRQKKQSTRVTYNLCIFPNGGECEEEAYFTGRCDQTSDNLTGCLGYSTKEPCLLDYNPVCARLVTSNTTSNETVWKTFSNPCLACTTSTKTSYTRGYILGECTSTTTTLQSNPYLAAAKFCEDSGYAYRTRKRLSGKEYGVCVFGLDNECDAEEYFRGTCKPK